MKSTLAFTFFLSAAFRVPGNEIMYNIKIYSLRKTVAESKR